MRPLGVVLGSRDRDQRPFRDDLAGTVFSSGRAAAASPPRVDGWHVRSEQRSTRQAGRGRLPRRRKEDQKELKRLVQKRPPIADKPPYPKARTGERVYEFGSMGVNEEKKHKFHIDNRGQAPLLIAKGPTNCKCTISNISQSTVAPGGSAEIEMSWTPRETTTTFAKTATIWTNDPGTFRNPIQDFRQGGPAVRRHSGTQLARRPCDRRSRRSSDRHVELGDGARISRSFRSNRRIRMSRPFTGRSPPGSGCTRG